MKFNRIFILLFSLILNFSLSISFAFAQTYQCTAFNANPFSRSECDLKGGVQVLESNCTAAGQSCGNSGTKVCCKLPSTTQTQTQTQATSQNCSNSNCPANQQCVLNEITNNFECLPAGAIFCPNSGTICGVGSQCVYDNDVGGYDCVANNSGAGGLNPPNVGGAGGVTDPNAGGAGGSGGSGGFTLPNPLAGGGVNTFADFMQRIASIATIIGLPLVVVFMIYSGFLFVSARGSDEKLETAKKTFFWAVIGALLVVGAYAIATAIQNFAQHLQ